MPNSVKNPVGICQNIIVPETDNPKPFLFEKARAGFVFRDLLRMLSAINFDDKRYLQAYEVDNIGADRPLTAKSVAVKLFATQT